MVQMSPHKIQRSPSATSADVGNYAVTVTVNGCTSAPGTTSVVVNPKPATPVPASNSPICGGSTLSLSTTLVSGADYLWTGPAAFGTSPLSNPTVPNAATSYSGNYTLVITVNGCTSAPGTIAVLVNPPATADAGANQNSCNGSAVTLSGAVGGSASGGVWTTSGSGTFNNPNLLNAVYTPSAGDITAGSVNLTLTTNDPSGPCDPVLDVMTIVISSIPDASFSYSAPSYCQSDVDPSPIYGALPAEVFSHLRQAFAEPFNRYGRSFCFYGGYLYGNQQHRCYGILSCSIRNNDHYSKSYPGNSCTNKQQSCL